MKKTINYILLATLVVTLSSCTLAEDDAYYENNVDTMGEEDYYIPSGMEFTLRLDSDMNVIVDAEDYFFVDLACEGETVFDNCFGAQVGKSIDHSRINYHTASNTLNGERQPDVNTINLDLTFYAIKGNGFVISTTKLYENAFGEVKREEGTYINMMSGASLGSTFSGHKMDGTEVIVDYTLHFKTVDELEMVTVREFDKDDTLLMETEIPKDAILESLKLHASTEYYFIIESFVDSAGKQYEERAYHHRDEYVAYLYKYVNDKGFLNGDRLLIQK